MGYHTPVPGEKERLLLRTKAVLLLFAASLAGCGAADSVHPLHTPELRSAPEIFDTAQVRNVDDRSTKASAKPGKMRIGTFEKPEVVPEYEILEETPADRDGVNAVRLRVDTRSRNQADLTLIARHIKARYAAYDAVSVQFTDTSDVLSYNGGALIFNTYDGAYYMGYIYGPPNMKGYYVKAVE